MAKKRSSAEGEIEKTYQKKTQLEHILLRPDTYIGTTEKITEKRWVIDDKTSQMVNKEITYVPELIFGHLLTSSNYNDNERKITGGRNGFWAKLTNVFRKYN